MKTITICGSLRFYEAMIGYALNRPESYFLPRPESVKALAVRHHRERIQRSDSILVFNYGGYIGADTFGEIQFAEQLEKGVEYLETDKCGTCGGTGQCDVEPCPSCNHHSRFDCFEWSNIGRSWLNDSSIEKWFPFTAEELMQLRTAKETAETRVQELEAKLKKAEKCLDNLSTAFEVEATWYVTGSHVAGNHPHNQKIHRMLNGFSNRIKTLLDEFKKGLK